METYIKINFIIVKKMEQVYIIGKIILFISENGKIINVMDMVYLKMEIGRNIKENFFTIKEMDMVNISNMILVLFILGIGVIIKERDLVLNLVIEIMKKAKYMLDIGIEIIGMDMVGY